MAPAKNIFNEQGNLFFTLYHPEYKNKFSGKDEDDAWEFINQKHKRIDPAIVLSCYISILNTPTYDTFKKLAKEYNKSIQTIKKYCRIGYLALKYAKHNNDKYFKERKVI